MRRLQLSLIAHWAGVELHGEDVAIDAITHDTRSLAPGSLYVALRGDRFDGHEFAREAHWRGAVALLVERALDVDLPQVVVADSLLALAHIAAGLQRGRDGRVVAVTGSNGKTTVKTLLAAILRRQGETWANPGNRNNEIGLPLAVIDAPDDARFAVYEMGAGKPGDIAYLTDIVRPEVALVNNVAAAHLEGMGSLQGVAETKSAIYAALPAGGVAVVNADDAYATWFEQQVIRAGETGRRVLRFGLEHSAQVTARQIRLQPAESRFLLEVRPDCGPAACDALQVLPGQVEVVLPMPGRHNVSNALAAAALALACGVSLQDIATGLAGVQPVAGRQLAHVLASGAVLIDDSYNANPASLAAAIDSLAARGGQTWLVLGDMRELGEASQALHAEAGRHARAARIDRLYALGPLSAAAAAAFGEGARVFETHEALASALQADLRAHAAVSGPDGAPVGLHCLVKGSRGSAMERIVTALLATRTTHGEETSHAA